VSRAAIRIAAGLCALMLAGCAGGGARDMLSLVPVADGIEVAGSGGLRIGFGRDRDGALASAASVTGAPLQTVRCASGHEGVRVDDDLVMVFRSRTFVGWQTGDRSGGYACG
jgi:hypothetical protein